MLMWVCSRTLVPLLHLSDLLTPNCMCSGWLDFLAEVRQQVGQVVLLTCPTDRIQRENQQEGRKLVAERNRLLRAMVAAERGGSAAGAAGGGVVERQLQTGGSDGSSSSGSSRSKGGGQSGRIGGMQQSAGRPLLLVDIDGLTRDLPPGLAVAPLD